MRLQTRLPLITLPLIGLPMLVIGLVAYLYLESSAHQQARKNIHSLLDQISLQAGSHLSTARANIDLFASYPLVRYYTQASDDERYALIQRPLYKKLRDVQKAYPDYYELRIILPDGYEDLRVVNEPLVNLSENDRGNPVFQAFLNSGRDTYAQYAIDENTGHLALMVYKALRFSEDRLNPSQTQPLPLSGYLAQTIRLDYLQRLLDDNPLGEQGGIVVTSATGMPLLSPPSLTPDVSLPLPASSPPKEGPELLEVRIDGTRYLTMSHPLIDGVYLHALVPRATVMEQSQGIGLLVALVAAVSLVLTLTVMYWLIRHYFLRPVHDLLDGVRSISRGDLGVHLNLSRSDELGELSEAFNRMSGQLKRFHHRIQSVAFNDALTGLPNRALFSRKLQRLMISSSDKRKRMALLFLDLDNFKDINDSQGHQTGDTVLRIIASRLEENLRGDDFIARRVTTNDAHTLARLGGDEFTILIPDINSASQIARIAQRVIAALSRPIAVNELEFYIGASIGITLYPGDGETPEELIKNADLAMYQAKRLGKNNFQFYSETISQESVARIQLEQRLRKALEQGAFELYYQPIIDSASQTVVSFEALVRWVDDELGMITPERFIPLAEETGMIVKLGHWVMDEACRQQRAWRMQGLRPVKVAVNVSGVQLNKSDVCKDLADLLRLYELPTDAIYLELTESAIIEGHDKALETIRALRKQGTLVALDDFGTGYSSLSYLRNLPIDILKIDRSFIGDPSQHDQAVILSSIIDMAHALKLKVVAEGVETQPQFDYLAREQCDLIQGYLFSRPRPASEVPPLLEAFDTPLVASDKTTPA